MPFQYVTHNKSEFNCPKEKLKRKLKQKKRGGEERGSKINEQCLIWADTPTDKQKAMRSKRKTTRRRFGGKKKRK